MSNNDLLTQTMMDTILTRRSFLKWSAAVGGAAAAAGTVGFGLKAIEADAQSD